MYGIFFNAIPILVACKACEETQLGGANMPQMDASYCFDLGAGGGLNSHQVPLVPIEFSSNSFLFPSITDQTPFVLIKFSDSSHQIHLVPINSPSKSFCSHQFPFVPNPTLHKPPAKL